MKSWSFRTTIRNVFDTSALLGKTPINAGLMLIMPLQTIRICWTHVVILKHDSSTPHVIAWFSISSAWSINQFFLRNYGYNSVKVNVKLSSYASEIFHPQFVNCKRYEINHFLVRRCLWSFISRITISFYYQFWNQ